MVLFDIVQALSEISLWIWSGGWMRKNDVAGKVEHTWYEKSRAELQVQN
jgi:hypothetical protein